MGGRARRVDAERAAIEYRIRSEIAGASEVLALRQAALSQEQPGAAEELVQIAEVAYREGEVGILELLDAVRTASRARIRSIELRLDARLAQIALERAVGELVALKSLVSTARSSPFWRAGLQPFRGRPMPRRKNPKR